MAPTQVEQWHTLQDGLENLTRHTAPMPTPGPDQVLVEIRALALNYRDTEGISPSLSISLLHVCPPTNTTFSHHGSL